MKGLLKSKDLWKNRDRGKYADKDRRKGINILISHAGNHSLIVLKIPWKSCPMMISEDVVSIWSLPRLSRSFRIFRLSAWHFNSYSTFSILLNSNIPMFDIPKWHLLIPSANCPKNPSKPPTHSPHPHKLNPY